MLYVKPEGEAKFGRSFLPCTACIDKDAYSVLPLMRKKFNSLNLTDRKALQKILSDQGFYFSSVDGKWGRHTLLALAQFAVVRLNTISVHQEDTVNKILVEVQKINPAVTAKSIAKPENKVKAIEQESAAIKKQWAAAEAAEDEPAKDEAAVPAATGRATLEARLMASLMNAGVKEESLDKLTTPDSVLRLCSRTSRTTSRVVLNAVTS